MGICSSKEPNRASEPTAGRTATTLRHNVPAKASETSIAPSLGTGTGAAEPAETTKLADALAEVRPVDAAPGLKKEIKVLLLGSGESGKSTIIKQMKILHQNGFSEEEKADYKTFVFRNIVEGARNLITGVRDIKPELIADAAAVEEILAYEPLADPQAAFDATIATKLLAFYQDSNIQTFISQYRSAFYLPDSAGYFFESLPRIATPDYVPDVTDILRTRKKTSGIYDTKFQMGSGLDIHMYDVGGQRSERRKWIHCFDDVTLIIFCVALSEYDQVLLEENSQNRLEESLILFDSVINSRWFLRTSVVLFLNKIDVFAQKLPHSPMENFFPDYSGGSDINKAAKYILWRFNQVNRSGLNIYPHVTQATDTSNIELVFAAVRETVLQNSLKDSGIL